MARRGEKKLRPPIGDPADPKGMGVALLGFLEWLRIRNYSEYTVLHREKYLRYFITWCEARNLLRPVEITRPILERYQRWLYHYRKTDGKPLSFRSQLHHLLPIRQFFKWLAKTNRILANPASEIDLPRSEHRLPKHILTCSEVEQVLNQVNPKDMLGVRDRAILETLYSTGMRRLELIGLKLYDLDRERGTVMIRQGKGKKDRMIPIGERASLWIEKYLSELRPSLVVEPDAGYLFLTSMGEGMMPPGLSLMVRRFIKKAGIGKTGSCHLFRHTMATLMLENGADVRFIQEMLGHAQLTTTQIYTQVSIRKLKEIHTATHPSAKMERTRRVPEAASEPSDAVALPSGEEARAVLFSTLAAESDEE